MLYCSEAATIRLFEWATAECEPASSGPWGFVGVDDVVCGSGRPRGRWVKAAAMALHSLLVVDDEHAAYIR